jgi:hypothetical protein
MPDTYTNYATSITGATGAVTIYAGITGTAIVNGIHIANSNTTVANSVSVQLFKGATGYYIVRGAAVPIQSTYQALDTPIPLTTGDSLKATQGVTAGLDIIVSVLEST